MSPSRDGLAAISRRLGLTVAALTLAGCASNASNAPDEIGSPTGGAGGTTIVSTGGAAGASQSAGAAMNAAGGRPSYGTGGAGATGHGGVPNGNAGAAPIGGAPSASSGGTSGNGGAPVGGSSGKGGVPNGSTGGATTSNGSYWKPGAGTSWQWQLTGDIDTSVDVVVYDIDGFDNDASVVKALHDKGRKVICYLSVGSYEDWRPDASKFPKSVLGKDYPGWPGEKFVDIRAQGLRDIMAARFDVCKQKGFDGVEPDNMDVYSNNSGFPLTEQDGVDYAKWMATEVHSRGMNIGQKNASELTDDLQPTFDWMLTEDCYDQGWCADVQGYVDNGKPVFMSEYTDTGVDFKAACSWGKPKKYSPILKGRDLDAPVEFCP